MTILGRTQLLALVGCVAAAAIAAAALATSSPAPTNWSITFTPLAQRILVGADANAVVLPDGRIRLYWATGNGSGSAVSKDGVHFSKEPGIRLDRSIGGPHTRIVALPDGG